MDIGVSNCVSIHIHEVYKQVHTGPSKVEGTFVSPSIEKGSLKLVHFSAEMGSKLCYPNVLHASLAMNNNRCTVGIDKTFYFWRTFRALAIANSAINFWHYLYLVVK